MGNENYTEYQWLMINENATDEEIEKAFKDRLANIYVSFKGDKIKKEEYEALYDKLKQARDRLLDPTIRAEIDKAIAEAKKAAAASNDPSSMLAATGARVTTGDPSKQTGDPSKQPSDPEDPDKDDKKGKKAGWLQIAAVTGAIIIGLAASGWVGYEIHKNMSRADEAIVSVVAPGDQKPSDSAPEETPADSKDDQRGGETEEGKEQQPVVEVKNYGDITDEALVEERANTLAEEFTKAGMFNLTTGIPYTAEEIKTLILYANGAYVPATEEEGTTLYTEFLNFICASINIDHTLIQSAYLGGEDSFKETIEENIKNQQRPDIVTAFTYGDSYAAPYLYWLQEQYYDMRYTTDREEATRIFNEVFQSYADVMKGDGFTLDGVTYKEVNMLGLDKVAVSNLYVLFGLNAEVFRTTATQDEYKVTNHLISADPEMQTDTVSYDEVSAWLNGACAIELIPLDDEGLPLVTSGEDGKSLGELTQINTIYRAKANYIDKNTKTLSK